MGHIKTDWGTEVEVCILCCISHKEMKWVGFAGLATVSHLSFLIAMLLTVDMEIEVVTDE